MPTGIVKFFDEERGFGFIEAADGSGDIFVHATAVRDSGLTALQKRDVVAYEVTADKRNGKPKAVGLRLTSVPDRGPRWS